jgi:crotonobetainyl-CoA:carnitine CoA-transferase CaiB-like acyl-CoA transferase
MTKGRRKSLLGNIRVLDLADEKGSFCSKILTDLGSTVIKIERPGGDPSRKLGPYCHPNSDADRRSLFFAYHNANKLGFALDLETEEGKGLFQRLVKEADILVETYPPGHLDKLGLEHGQLSHLNPQLIHISITGFGKIGPKSGYICCDTIASACGGQMYLSGAPPGPPIKLYGEQTYYVASLFGAVAALLGLKKRRVTGKGCFVDLSCQEAVASTLDHVMVNYWQRRTIAGRQNNLEYGNPASILPCKDGYIEITVLLNWETLIELMAADGKAANLLEKEWQEESHRRINFDHILKVVGEWTRNYSKKELFELGQAMGFPWAPICTPTEVLESAQLRFRRFFVAAAPTGDGFTIQFPGCPYKFSSFSPTLPRSAPSLGEHSKMILEKGSAEIINNRESQQSEESRDFLSGIRVVDLTRVLAGPYATRILADFGAEVIKIQSARTAQGAEQNKSEYFKTWNRNKKSVTLNLDFREARDSLLKLITISDVVVENFSPRVMQNWGFTYERLKEIKPDLVMLSISAMGRTGPWKNMVGYGTTFHALSGLTAMTSRSLEKPVPLGHAYGDIITGLYAAIAVLAALEHKEKTGKGQYIDLSGYEALCTLMGPALMEAAMDRNKGTKKRPKVEQDMDVPCGCYPCAGRDRWCVIAVSNQEECQTLCRISGNSRLKAKSFPKLEEKKKKREKLDELISRWTSRHKADALVRQLQKAGISAGIVQNAKDLATDRHLAARNFFVTLENAEKETTIADRTALQFSAQKPEHWRSAPSLGEHNHEVLVDLVGLSEMDFLSYMEKGIIS